MKHNLRMAFLSLLLVLTLGVMPAFAESADHAMDWTHGIGTDVTSALPFEDELFFISGSQLLRVDDPEYEPEVVCNLEDIIWSEALKQSGYYGQVMLLSGGAELVLFSANEGRLYSFVPPTDDTMVRMQMVAELDYSTVPQMGWKKFPIAKDLYDVTVEQCTTRKTGCTSSRRTRRTNTRLSGLIWIRARAKCWNLRWRTTKTATF